MSIGLPYKGSKSEIAEELVSKLPPCGKILDACCGGGAVLVALAQSLKYKSVVGNDKNPATVALLDAVLINKGKNRIRAPGAMLPKRLFCEPPAHRERRLYHPGLREQVLRQFREYG